MKILFVTTGLSGGGAETQLVRLGLSLKARGHDVQVVSLLPPKVYESELSAAGIPVHCLNMKRGVPNPAALFRLAALIRRLRPAVVHAHMIHANLLARLTRLFCRMPVLVCTAHNVYEMADAETVVREYSLRDLFYRVTDSLADVTTQICQAGAARYLQNRAISARKLRVIYNGVDILGFAPNESVRNQVRQELGLQNRWVWLAAGRFVPAKDYPNLLKAFAIYLKSHSEDVLIIAGDGPAWSSVQELARTLGIQTAIRFLGFRSDVRELMQAADAFVMSSKFEGLPLVLVEAQACGLPVVATRVGGNPEVVLDGVTGYLAPPENSEMLAQAMARLRGQSEPVLADMRHQGREHACAHFDLAQIIRQWESLYNQLVAHRHPRA